MDRASPQPPLLNTTTMATTSIRSSTNNQPNDLFDRRPLNFDPSLKRNRINRVLTSIAGVFGALAVLPLFLVLLYVLFQGGRLLSPTLFTQLPPPPGLDGGGIGNAVIGTILVTLIASAVAIPIGVGGGIYLNEYSTRGWFSQFISFGNDILAGVPSIITGVFVYGIVVSTRLFFNQSFSAVAGGLALAVLMLPGFNAILSVALFSLIVSDLIRSDRFSGHVPVHIYCITSTVCVFRSS